jgi:TonB family protein
MNYLLTSNALLLLWPVAEQGRPIPGLDVVAMAQIGGTALLTLLLAGAALLLLSPQQKRPPDLVQQLGISLMGPLTLVALSTVLWVMLWLKGVVNARTEDGFAFIYCTISLSVVAFLFWWKWGGAKAFGLGSVGWTLLLVGYQYSSTTHIPAVPSAPIPPLGLVQSDVRDAPIPASAQTEASDSYPAVPVFNDLNNLAVVYPPGFPGAEAGLRAFVRKHLRYPSQARLNHVEGMVYVLFTVQADGHITDIETTSYSIGDGCDAEARRVVKLLPGFAPAYRAGMPIATKTELCFGFSAN